MGPKEKILIVEDSHDIRELLNHTLTISGYQVIKAVDGQQGLEFALEHEPDLIMLDNHMPRMNGLTMLSNYRQKNEQTPIIFMTQFGSERIAIDAFRLGVSNYLIKPFTIEDARLAVERSLREVRLLREKERLDRSLLAADTVRQTVVTLSHHINNQLTVANAGFALLRESLKREIAPSEQDSLVHIVQESQVGLTKIAAVLRILQKVSQIKPTEYFSEVQMLDIEEALQRELGDLEDKLE